MAHPDYDHTRGLRVERTLAHLRSIPDPFLRARACDEAADQARSIQAKIAEIRRHAVYEATLKPGATGASVAAQMGVSTKAVSLASKRFRADDLNALHAVIDMYLAGASTDFNDLSLRLARSSKDPILVAKAVLEADRARDHTNLGPDEWAVIDAHVERAQTLVRLAQDVPATIPEFHEPGAPTATDDDIEPHLRVLARTVDSLPGIRATAWPEISMLDDPEPEPAWYLSWSLLAAEEHSSVFDSGPHREGWATTEWLVWLVRDFERGGLDVQQYPSSPPPFLNTPGESLSFVVYAPQGGPRPLDAGDFAKQVARTWDETGYTAVDWPEDLTLDRP